MRTTLRKIWQVLNARERKHFYALAAGDIVISIADIVFLAGLLWIIQFYLPPATTRPPAFLPGWMTGTGSLWLIGIFGLLFLLKNGLAYLLTQAHYTFIGKVAARITRNNLDYFQQDSFTNFVHTDSSVHIHKIYFQPVEFCQYILSGLQQIITQCILVLLAALAITWYNTSLFIILFLVLIPPAFLVFYFIRKRLTGIKKDIRQSNERSFQHLQDALKGYVEGHVYGKNEFLRTRFTEHHARYSRQLFRSISLQQLPARLIEVFAVLGLFILLAASRWMSQDGPVNIIVIGAFVAAAYKIIPGLVKIINLSGQLQAHRSTLDDLVKSAAHKSALPPADIRVNKIEFRHVSFRHKDQPLLEDISFTIEKGDLAAISGYSGAGKTTLINLLLGFLEPDQGQICINDQVLDKEARKAIWPSLSYVRQQHFFIHDSLEKNITLSSSVTDPEMLEQAIRNSGLREWIGQSADSTGMIISENGRNISGGQQQRVALARALYRDPELLILDESFSELDKATVHSFLGNLQQMTAAGKMVILITHDNESLTYCNKIIALGAKR